MSHVLHRTTGEFRRSVNTPDFPVAEWIHNPDLSAVAGVPSKYWKIVGDTVTEMTTAEKAAVDVAELASLRLAAQQELVALVDAAGSGVTVRALLVVLNKRDNYLVNRILELQTELTNLRDAIANSSGPADGIRLAAAAVTMQFSRTDTRPRGDVIDDLKAETLAGSAD